MKSLGKVVDILRKPLCWILHKYKLYKMDRDFYMSPLHEGFLYPPSFYYTHTPEEIKEIEQKEIAELREMVEEYDRKYNSKVEKTP